MSEIDLAQQSVEAAGYVRFLVIKRLRSKHDDDREFVRMFQDEARINAELQHANITQVYDFGVMDDEYFIAMEYIAGADLRTIQRAAMAMGRTIPIRICLRILADILAGLHYAHSRLDTYGQPMNIVHRDVNPRNIMLSFRGEVKLIDFGVAKSDTRSEQTVQHTLKGKFAYMAPEQIDGSVRIDARADLFAAGLVMHEIINNCSPFVGLEEVQIMHRILAGKIPDLTPPPEVDDPSQIIAIHKCVLSLNREDRYTDAEEMREAIIAASKPLGGLASDSELASFLVGVIRAELQQRGERLQEYREMSLAGRKKLSRHGPVAPQNSSQGMAETVAMETFSSIVLRPKRIWPLFVGGLLLSTTTLGLGILIALKVMSPAEIVVPQPVPQTMPDRPTTETPEAASTTPEEDPLEEDPTETPVPRPTPAPIARPQPTPEPMVVPQPTIAPVEEEASNAEEEKTGFLNITSRPIGLTVLVNGNILGVTPLKAQRMQVGDHTLIFRDDRTGQTWSMTTTVVEGQTRLVNHRGE